MQNLIEQLIIIRSGVEIEDDQEMRGPSQQAIPVRCQRGTDRRHVLRFRRIVEKFANK